MRSVVSALGRRQAALTRRWHHSQSSTIVHHRQQRQRYCRLHSIGNGWQQQHHHQNSTPRYGISTTSSILSTPDSFHGISLPDDEKLQPPSPPQQQQQKHQQQQRTTQSQIKEAEVVTSDEEKIMTRELIKEMTRAEMSAHSTVVADIGKKSNKQRSSAHSVVANFGKKADGNDDGDDNCVLEDSLLENEESNALGAYERLSLKLEEAQRRHQEIVNHKKTLAYAHSCMVLGELHYKLGNMDQSQEFYMDSLQDLMERSNNCSSNSSYGDDGDNDGSTKITRRKMMIAQSMHALATIHARCGEFEEASGWYDEALKNKLQFSEDIAAVDVDVDSPSDLIPYRYELGKTYNGMAALEIMKGGDVQWDKAMSLFEQAERNFLHGYELDDGQRTVEDDDGSGNDHVLNATNDPSSSSTRDDVSKAAIEQMSPLHVEFLIGIRSNMGELLRRRGQSEEALQKYQLALDMARLALEIENEKAQHSTKSEMMISDNGPSRVEQGNTIVDLLVNIADNHASAEDFDAAAEAYEQALSSHVFFRRWSDENDDDNARTSQSSSSNVLPATIASSTKIKFDLNAATTIEAAIRNNLATALGQIGQDKLALEHYEASLAVKRRVGGDFHMEIAHTLMGMGALLGGPLKDFTKGLNCFKEALFIYRTNLDELSGENSSSGNQDGFFGDEDSEEIDKHIQNALKNISLIEAALLKNRDGASNRRRR